MRKRLRQILPFVLASDGSSGLYNSFDIVGDIAIVKLPESSSVNASEVAKSIMGRHKKVKTVLVQSGPVAGGYRTRKLTFVAGENKTRTVNKESGCLFAVDVESCYYSPRLSFEHRRIAKLVAPDEVVVNMFAGIGCFSIAIAKVTPRVKAYSIDINPIAVQFMKENIQLNNVADSVIPILGDSKLIIEDKLQGIADRVLMPLPEKALEYLPCAVSALKPAGGWIHYHSFERAPKTSTAIDLTKQKIAEKLSSMNVPFEVSLLREVRKVGPSKFQIVADVLVKAV